MMDASILEKALAMALQAHRGQKDKSGLPYVFHPIRMMLQLTTLEEQTVALLHDVLEDSPFTAEDLRKEGFSSVVIEAVKALTREKDEPYLEYIRRVKQNRLARVVKLADIKENLNANRLTNLSEKDCQRLERYLKAREILLAP
jgi:(p)ppGpp synthase/HD superfamily hydrolase